MAHKSNQAPENYFNETDAQRLDDLAGDLATHRLGELERDHPLTNFTAEDLFEVHRYILQDVYPWSGQLRTEEVGAMGMAMCRPEYVPEMLNSVMKAIEKNPPSRTNKAEAIATIADHWGEITIVHPFRDGNSRTQRFFFDQMLGEAGWAIDWTKINASEVHAARYIAALTTDSRFLADAIRPGVGPADMTPTDTLSSTEGQRENVTSAQIFHQMRHFRLTHPGQSFHEYLTAPKSVRTPPAAYDVMVNPNPSNSQSGKQSTVSASSTPETPRSKDYDAVLGD